MLADLAEMEVHAGMEWLVMYARVAVVTREDCVKQVSYVNAQEYFMRYICFSCNNIFIHIYPCPIPIFSQNQTGSERWYLNSCNVKLDSKVSWNME